MNETIQTILKRRSVRSYEDRQVSDEDIALLLECAKAAPSGMNTQAWHFTVLQNRGLMARINEANRQEMLAADNEMIRKIAGDPHFDCWRGGQTVILLSGEKGTGEANCANAAENIVIAATSLGLGSCYIASFKICLEGGKNPELLRELGIPENYEPLFAIALGYPKETPQGERKLREGTVNYVR